MERAPISVPIGGQTKTPGGELIRVDFVNRKVARRDSAIVKDVHDHEAHHAGVALATDTRVLHLTTIRDGNTLGSVTTDQANKHVAAVTWGRPGAGSDEFKTMLMGGDEATAMAARSIASSVSDGISEIAKAAAVQGELSEREVTEAFEDGIKGREIVVYTTNQDGSVTQERKRTKGKFVEVIPLFPGIEEEIPEAA